MNASASSAASCLLYTSDAAEEVLIEKTRAAARATDDYVHENPWQAVGIGAGVGFLLGLVLGRR